MQFEEAVSFALDHAHESMNHALEHLERELTKVRTGKASPAMLNGLMVSYYGNPTPLNQVANVSVSDSRTVVIQPWEKSMIQHIEKAIFEANLGVSPQNDGELIRLSIPPLTEERRKEMVKKTKVMGEDTKVGIRSARRDAMEEIKKAMKDGYPEDLGKRKEAEVQTLTDNYIKKVDVVVEAKDKEIMTI